MCLRLELKQFVVVAVSELCPVDLSQEVQAEIQKLRDCISVLFMFVRQPIQDEEFVTILNGWMEQLVCFASFIDRWYCNISVMEISTCMSLNYMYFFKIVDVVNG